MLGQESDHLRGAVILTCSDEGIEILIRSGNHLRDKFIIEETSGEIRACLLDKLSTYEKAKEAAIPVPRFWSVSSSSDLERVKGDSRFPLTVKPQMRRWNAQNLPLRDLCPLHDSVGGHWRIAKHHIADHSRTAFPSSGSWSGTWKTAKPSTSAHETP